MSDSIYNPISIVIHFYALSLCDEISLHIVISINFRVIRPARKRRIEDAHIISLLRSRNENVFEGGRGGKRTVSTLAHLKIRSMNEHVRTYVHTNDVVVAALLSIGRCNRTGNKLDPLVEEHHRAFLLNSRKRRSTRRVSVAFRATVAARHISPPPHPHPDGKVSVVTNGVVSATGLWWLVNAAARSNVTYRKYCISCVTVSSSMESTVDGWIGWMGVCDINAATRGA